MLRSAFAKASADKQAQHDKTGVWRAECDGARNIVPKAWGGRFPFQVKVKLLTSEIVEIPKPIVTPIAATSTNGRLDNLLDAGRSEELMKWVASTVETGLIKSETTRRCK
jgi:hypothetical protein